MARQQTGKGQMVEGALLKTALMMGNANLIEQAVIERDRQPTGNRSQTSGPGDIFRTADGWLLCSVIGEPLFRRWVDLMSEDNGTGTEGEDVDWLNDPRFADDLSRGDHGEVIGDRMAAWCASRSTEEAVETLNAAMIPSGPVYSMQQALDDPHIAEVGSFAELDYPDMPRPAPVAQPSVRLTENAGHDPSPRADPGRAHRRDPGRPRLQQRPDRRVQDATCGVAGCRCAGLLAGIRRAAPVWFCSLPYRSRLPLPNHAPISRPPTSSGSPARTTARTSAPTATTTPPLRTWTPSPPAA